MIAPMLLRLDYHQGDLHRPLLAAVAPLLFGQLDWVIGLRAHWQGGHHLQLRLRDEAALAHDTIVASLRDWLIDNPSTGLPTGTDFATFARDQARAEGDRGEPQGLRQDNSVTRQEEIPHHYLGSAALGDLRLIYEVATARPSLKLLAMGRGAIVGRLQIQLAQVVAMYPLGAAAQGVRSLRAHCLNFLERQPVFEARFAATYEKIGADLRARVARVLDGDPPGDGWTEALKDAALRLDAMPPAVTVAAGQHGLDIADEAIGRWVGPALTGASPERLRAFGRNRVLINLVYAQCPLLGLDALTRFACAYLTYRAISDVLGLAEATLEPMRRAS